MLGGLPFERFNQLKAQKKEKEGREVLLNTPMEAGDRRRPTADSAYW